MLFVISWLVGEIKSFRPGDVSLTSLAAVLWLIISGGVIGFVAYWLLENVSTSLVSTYTFVNPVIAVLLGTLVLSEPFSCMMLLGTGLVIISVIVIWNAERARSRRANDPADRDVRHLAVRKT